MTRKRHLPTAFTATLLVLILSISSLSLTSCAPKPTTNDYDRLCEIIQAGTSTPSPGVSIQEQADQIAKNIYANIPDGNALNAFTSVQMAPPGMRYELFKEEAERILDNQWDCPAWEQLQADLAQ